MNSYRLDQKPSLDKCPEEYCFCWVPPGGTADLSGKVYDSFDEAVSASNHGVVFLNGGCAAPFGPCKRESKNSNDNDCYEPFNSILKKSGFPELFFCNPLNLDEQDKSEYELMAKELWDKNA